MKVDDIMTPRAEIIWMDIDDPPEEIQRKISSGPFSLFPIGRKKLDNVLGIVQAKDLLPCSMKDGKVDLKSSLLPPLFIPESMRALKVLERFKQTGIHLAIVLDEYGSVQGILTLTDLLEAMVGDIPHIKELAEPMIVKRENGSWLVDGALPVTPINVSLKLRMNSSSSDGPPSAIYLVLTSTLPAPLWTVISILLAALS